jgi:hypothetical protein
MVPLQIPGGVELVFLPIVLLLNALVLVGVLGGLGYVVLWFRSGGQVDERLDRIERKIGRLEARVDHLDADDGTRRKDADGGPRAGESGTRSEDADGGTSRPDD